MQRRESSYPGDWLRIAEKDLARVKTLLDVPDPEAAGFFLQQAVEKFLKAFLLSRNWELQRIHDLEVLLNAALRHDPTLEPFRAVCQRISGYYLIERYPLITESGLTNDDVSESLVQVTPLVERPRSTTSD